jgi:hypothetical protein
MWAMTNPQVERLKALPQRPDEVWQGSLVRMPSWVVGEDKKPYRPVTALWVSLRTGRVGAGEGIRPPQASNFAMALDALAALAADRKLAGYRPGKLEVNDPALAEHLGGLLAEAQVRVEYRAKLLALERALLDMEKHFNQGRVVPGPLEGKDVTVERMQGFAEAAKGFFEAAPWQHLGNYDLLEIETPSVRADLRFAVVLGAGGEEFGLGFYRSPEHFWAPMAEEGAAALLSGGGVWAVTFETITGIPLRDADLWEDHALPVAAENAYPAALRYEERGRVRRPGAEVLGFLEGLLRALAQTSEEEMDAGRWCKKAKTFDGEVEYVLALPFFLKPPDRKYLMDHGIMPDRRAMERFHAQLGRFLEDKKVEDIEELNALVNKEFVGKEPDPSKYSPRTPLEKARDLCYEAFDAIGQRRVKLAREALAVSADCADAYVLLAEHVSDQEKALALYAQGVEAGKRALGDEMFEEEAAYCAETSLQAWEASPGALDWLAAQGAGR